jgi:hypothetical protein
MQTNDPKLNHAGMKCKPAKADADAVQKSGSGVSTAAWR